MCNGNDRKYWLLMTILMKMNEETIEYVCVLLLLVIWDLIIIINNVCIELLLLLSVCEWLNINEPMCGQWNIIEAINVCENIINIEY